ncbi:MAG: hypothetical protein ACW98I_11895 [Candidatus Hodarchaeales archaeon]|jgi:hypothetical protein
MNPGSINERLHSVEEGELDKIKNRISHLKNQLKIPESTAKIIKSELADSYQKAEDAVSLVGGSADDISKMWGYNYGSILYNYLSQRDTLEGRQGLSFIKMALGYELTLHGFSEVQYASFAMGLGLRFMLGFENLKKSISEIEQELQKLDTLPNDAK